jgi:GMP synthase (glutamine-hydrolysing)
MSVDANFLLLQIRNPDDPMREQEIQAFSSALPCDPRRITTADLITQTPSHHLLDQADVVLIGGSGDYSVTHEADWLDRTYELIRELRRRCLPTFGSCWGFQAIAKAFGGCVVHDMARAELGTPEVVLTAAGRADPIFGALGNRFMVPVGHEDSVVQMPKCCALLGESSLAYHVLCVDDAPMYATQFHPELTSDRFFERVRRYPRYVEKIVGLTVEEFCERRLETPKMPEILPRFLKWVL